MSKDTEPLQRLSGGNVSTGNSPKTSVARLVRFAVVGVLAAGVYTAVAWIAAVRWGWATPIAGFVAYLVSMPLAYLLHRVITFQSRAKSADEFARFVVSSCSGLVLSSALPAGMTSLGLPYALSLAMTCILVPTINYAMLTRWVFLRINRHG